MRALIGLLVLGTLFIMAASWQKRMTSRLHDDRAQRYNVADDSAANQEGWSRLILGRPSGAEPLIVPEPQPPAASYVRQPAAAAPPAPVEEPEPTPPQRFRKDQIYTVQPGEVLSRICQEHYTVRPLPTLIERVATYNDLSSPDELRAGDELLLPDPAVLFPGR